MSDEARVEGQSADTLTPSGRRAIWGAFVGFIVDSFDIYLPLVALAPAMAYFLSPEIPESTAITLGAMIFAVTLIGRPIGAMIFGNLADTIGRRRTTIIAVTGFGVFTMLIGLLPGYQQWGIASVILLIILRLVDGIFLGGEYTSANPLAMEYSPKHRRGIYGGVIQAGASIAFVLISLVTLVLLLLIPAGDLNSPYVQWGWRIPFFIGAAMAFALALYYAYFVNESEIFLESEKSSFPLGQVFRGDNLRPFLQVFLLMSGAWLVLQAVGANIPRQLASVVGVSNLGVPIVLSVAWIALSISFVVIGALSQRIGRRMAWIVSGIIAATAGPFFYYLLLNTSWENPLAVVLLASVAVVSIAMALGLPTVYITERFRTDVRGSAFGLGYSLAIILPSFFTFYQTGLSTFMPFEYTVLVLYVVGGLLLIIGAAIGPETKDVDFRPVKATSSENRG